MGKEQREYQGLFVLVEALAAALGAGDPQAVAIEALEQMGRADIEAVVMIELVDRVTAACG